MHFSRRRFSNIITAGRCFSSLHTLTPSKSLPYGPCRSLARLKGGMEKDDPTLNYPWPSDMLKLPESSARRHDLSGVSAQPLPRNGLSMENGQIHGRWFHGRLRVLRDLIAKPLLYWSFLGVACGAFGILVYNLRNTWYAYYATLNWINLPPPTTSLTTTTFAPTSNPSNNLFAFIFRASWYFFCLLLLLRLYNRPILISGCWLINYTIYIMVNDGQGNGYNVLGF